MRQILLNTIVAAVLLNACAFQKQYKIQNADWLAGTWENQTSRGSVYEEWTKISDDQFSGKSYLIKDEAEIILETIRLIEEQDTLFYIPKVINQNDGLEVRFALKSIDDSTLVFENNQHDFPQKIAYHKISSDSLRAIISGVKNGEERQIIFPMKRIK